VVAGLSVKVNTVRYVGGRGRFEFDWVFEGESFAEMLEVVSGRVRFYEKIIDPGDEEKFGA
jgi:hypothetical protein